MTKGQVHSDIVWQNWFFNFDQLFTIIKVIINYNIYIIIIIINIFVLYVCIHYFIFTLHTFSPLRRNINNISRTIQYPLSFASKLFLTQKNKSYMCFFFALATFLATPGMLIWRHLCFTNINWFYKMLMFT